MRNLDALDQSQNVQIRILFNFLMGPLQINSSSLINVNKAKSEIYMLESKTAIRPIVLLQIENILVF